MAARSGGTAAAAAAVQPPGVARARALLGQLHELEPYLAGMLVRLSRVGREVDLATALSASAKRLAIKLCAAQASDLCDV